MNAPVNVVVVSAAPPGTLRPLACVKCEQPLATVSNQITLGVAVLFIACPCGAVSAISLPGDA
jgi:hypothetical protein